MVRWDKRGNGPGGRFENDSVDMLVQRVMVGPVPTILRGGKEDSRDKPENDSGGRFENDSVDMLVQRVMVGPVPTILRGGKEDSRDKPENDSVGGSRMTPSGQARE